MKADLHTHTTNSDGTKTIKELFKLAHQNGIKVLSITDHDVCKNVDEAFKEAEKYGITFIPGIELSTLHNNKSVHVLGYFTDDSYNNESMKEYYEMIRTGRETRTHKFIEKLKKYFDIDITYENVRKFSRGIIARPHIAKAIHEAYPEYSFDYIFDNFIGDHSKAYVPSSMLPVPEGVELLRKNNALAVLAHPVLLKEKIKEEVLSFDFDGVEARYFRNKVGNETLFRQYAKNRGFFITAGSDYHGIKNDTKHGDVGQVFLDGEDLEEFLRIYNNKVEK